MSAYSGMSYWDCYKLPIQVRKFLITTYNKRMEKQQSNNQTPVDKPLSLSEKMRINSDFSKVRNDPSKLASTFMQPSKK